MTGSPATDTLFEQALGLASPWYVDRVDFDEERRRLDIHLAFERGGLFTCASCEADGCKAYDSRTRSWRHLNCFEHEAYLHAPAPRIRCPECGVRQAALPWARSRSGFTLLFEGLVVAMASAMPVAIVARLVGEHDTRRKDSKFQRRKLRRSRGSRRRGEPGLVRLGTSVICYKTVSLA